MLSNPKRVLATLALFLAGGLAGYLLGNRGQNSVSSSNQSSSPRDASAYSRASNEQDDGFTRFDYANTNTPLSSETEISASVLAAARVRDVFRRRHDVYAVCLLLDRASIRTALEVAMKFPDSERENVQYALVARWLELDTNAAFTWVEALPTGKRRSDLMRDLFHTLGTKDPQAGLKLLDQYNADPNRSEDFTSSVFQAWAAHDPVAASDAALNLKKPAMQKYALGVALGRLAATDPQEAMARAGRISDAESRTDALRKVLRKWAEDEPEAAMSHVLAMQPGRDRNSAIAGVLGGVAVKNPAAIPTLVEQLPAGSNRTDMLKQIVSDLGYSEPRAAAELILLLPPGQQQNSTSQVTYSLSRQDRAAALEWVDRLASAEARNRAISSIISNWASSDPKAAAEYCVSHAIESPDILTSPVWNWAQEDAAGALAWSRTLPEGPQRESALSTSLGAIAKTDPRRAIELAASSLPPQKLGQCYASIAATWASTDPAAAAAWVAKLGNSDSGFPATMSLVTAWSRNDPAAAAAWALRSSENPVNHSAVVQQIASEWAGQDPAAAARWLETLPAGNMRDGAISSFATSAAGVDPEGAIAWAGTITQENQRENAIRNVYQNWVQIAPKLAREWLRSTNLVSDERRKRMLQNN